MSANPPVTIQPFDQERNIQYKITIVEATNLPGVDNHGTTSDPYVIVKFGNNVAQTNFIKKNLNPQWNQSFRFQSPVPITQVKFTVRDHNAIKFDVTLGEGEFNLEKMRDNTNWQAEIALTGHHIKPGSMATMKIIIERKNFTNFWGKVSKSLTLLEQKAKDIMMAKTTNLAKLAYLTAYNHMVSRKLQGSIDVEVQLAWFKVCMTAEVDAKEKEATGTIEIVEDTEHNTGPTQTKPTKGMKRNIEGRIVDVLDNLETTSTKLSSNVAVTVKAGIVIGFLISPIPKIELQVQVLFGIQVKAGVGIASMVATKTPSSNLISPLNTSEDEELKDIICKMAVGEEATIGIAQGGV